jgi:glycerol-3-phosphate dehydrogenase
MDRDLDRLGTEQFDLLVVGGGVHGAALMFEAAKRNLRVALIERGDFVSGASSNSLKILHGGLRHVQQLDIRALRRSVRARREWARLAPDLVRPLACVIPAHGLGSRSVLACALALGVNDLLSLDRNHQVRADTRLPRSALVGSARLRNLANGLVAGSVRHGAQWWDAQALDTEQLVLHLIRLACANGACSANYVEATEIIHAGGRVAGVRAIDCESGAPLEVRGRSVVLATGPGIARLVDSLSRESEIAAATWCGALNIVMKRQLVPDAALALSAKTPSITGKGIRSAERRELFVVPWRGRTMLGTHYVHWFEDRDQIEQRRAAVSGFLQLIDAAVPALRLSEGDIAFTHWGLLPLHRDRRDGDPLRLSSNASLCSIGGIQGLWSLSGPKFTTALETARRALDRIAGGYRAVTISNPSGEQMTVGMMTPLSPRDDPAKLELAAAAAARDSQALKLEDALLRRTGVGCMGYPGRIALEACARGMQRTRGWSTGRTSEEIDRIQDLYRRLHYWDGREPMLASGEMM